ncbi:MAG: hypothetical protein H7123_08755 [Thermoleophilia bacterium]|nr:hypothetical protein [Thermoleophilia bacterium]
MAPPAGTAGVTGAPAGTAGVTGAAAGAAGGGGTDALALQLQPILQALVALTQQLTTLIQSLVAAQQVQGGGAAAAPGTSALSAAPPAGATPANVDAVATGGGSPATFAAASKPATTSPSSAAVTAAAHATSPPSGGGRAPDSVLMIGDSLGVGTESYLKKDLPGTKVTVDARVGRSLAEGMAHYDAVANKPKVVEMGLFTNDGPDSVTNLHMAITRTIADARARGGRVVWSTIVRPDVGGKSYDAANKMLRDMAAANPDVMKLVDWQQAVASHPNFIGGDHVHGTAAGYAWRAQAYADAART